MNEKPPAYEHGAAPPGYPPAQGYPPPAQGYPPPPVGQPQPGYQTSTVVVQPSVVVGGAVMFTQFPQNVTCPSCHANIVTQTEFVLGTLTWIIVGILFLIGWWLCCWIPCIVDGCKDVVHKCPNCQHVVGQYRRM